MRNMLDLLKQILTKIKDIAYRQGLIADYIVEYGTSGIWSYEKRASGIAKCWGNQTITNSTWNAWGNAYASLVISGVKYPFAFIEAPDEIITVSTPAGSCYPLIYADNTTTTSGRAQTVRPGIGSTVKITYHYRVCGKWKSGGVLTNLISHLQRRWVVC